MRRVSGFTLIELIAVILILGILAAVAVPQVVNLSGNAKTAAVQGVAGGLASAASLNYANRSAQGTGVGVAVTSCQDAVSTLVGSVLDAKYAFSVSTRTVAAGVSTACTLHYSGNTPKATVNVVGIA